MIKKSNTDVEGKMDAIKNIRSAMSKLMKDGLHGELGKLKEVKVAAPDKESLKAGLEKAKQLVEKGPEMEEEATESEMPESEEETSEMESPEEASKEEEFILEEMDSPEKIDELIQKLTEKKHELMLKK